MDYGRSTLTVGGMSMKAHPWPHASRALRLRLIGLIVRMSTVLYGHKLVIS